jgi:non-canonical purine NTP pyrophosphatase (RdgB/HAM1 family)|nr:non-canonical purine NTP pyrophosphatase [Kofleriaceae bacterium]
MVVTIATTNRDKATLLAACLPGVEIRHVALALVEPQAESVHAVARAKAEQAFARVGGPVVVEDSGLVVASLGGFPGPYTKYALATIGAAGLVALAGGAPGRYTSAVAVARADGSVEVGDHAIDGSLATAVGGDCDGSWSDLWRVFVPAGERVPVSQLTAAARAGQLAALRDRLARWLAGVLR